MIINLALSEWLIVQLNNRQETVVIVPTMIKLFWVTKQKLGIRYSNLVYLLDVKNNLTYILKIEIKPVQQKWNIPDYTTLNEISKAAKNICCVQR